MIQGFPELQGINQGLAAPVFPVQPVKVFAPDHKGCNLLSVILDSDPAEISAHTKEKCSPEDVCGLQAVLFHVFTSSLSTEALAQVDSFILLDCTLREDTIEKESRFRRSDPPGAGFQAIN